MISQTMFHAGDPFGLTTVVTSTGPEFLVDEYLLLDVYGSYWFYPGWEQNIDFDRRYVEPGTKYTTIFSFTWPEVEGRVTGIKFLYLMTKPQTYVIISNVAQVEFSYE